MRYRILIITGLGWLLLDQGTKAWVKSSMIFPFHKNAGIAFGIPVPLGLQIVASIILIGILGFMALFSVNRFLFSNQCSFGIILGGAIGNLMDRIRTGVVIDFIKLPPFPLFNLADVGITVGLILLTLSTVIKNKNEQSKY